MQAPEMSHFEPVLIKNIIQQQQQLISLLNEKIKRGNSGKGQQDYSRRYSAYSGENSGFKNTSIPGQQQ